MMRRRPLFLGSRIPVTSAAGRRPAEKQPRPVGEHEVAADRLVRPVLGLIGVDDQLGSDRDGLLGHTLSDELVWTTAFDHPRRDFAVRVLDVEVTPWMIEEIGRAHV